MILLFILLTAKAHSSESIFNQTISSATNFFSPYYRAIGKKLTIIGEWDYEENNGKAMAYTVNHYFIEIYGGALQDQNTNKDSLRAMICHEVGHHLGGAPLMPAYYEDYYLFRGSSEGQADYYATSKCLKDWFQGEDHWSVIEKVGYSKKDATFCKKYFTTNKKVGLCIRIITAYKNMLSIDVNEIVNLNLASPRANYPYALSSSVTHPSKNCRLETAYAGVICQSEKKIGCLSFEQPRQASRPLCWAGIGFILEHESKLNKQRAINFINSLPITEFHRDPYDDDEVHENSLRLTREYNNVIPILKKY